MGPGMARKGDDKYGVTQFNGTNFPNWKFRVEVLLEEFGVKQCVSENCPSDAKEEHKEKWRKSDNKCKSLIVQCIADSHLEYVMGKNTSKEIWDSLLKTFERKGVASQLYLRRRLLTMKYSGEMNLESHFVKFDEIIRQLRSAGAKLENEDIVCHLLLTMPETYNNVVTALETLSPDTLTIEFVKGRLLDEEAKKSNSIKNEESSSDSAAFNAKNTGKFPFKCYNCDRVGHKSAECKLKKKTVYKGKNRSKELYKQKPIANNV